MDASASLAIKWANKGYLSSLTSRAREFEGYTSSKVESDIYLINIDSSIC